MGTEVVYAFLIVAELPPSFPAETVYVVAVNSQNLPTRWLWEDEEQWRHNNGRAVFSFPQSDPQFMAMQSPYHQSFTRNTQEAPLYSNDPEYPLHGLPAPSSSPMRASMMMTTNDFEVPGQRQKEVFPQPAPKPTPKPASRRRFIEVSKSHPLASTSSKKRIQRQHELKDEAYPLKLIRELDRISGRLPHVNKGKPVFGVIHVNNSVEKGLTVENVSTYTTVQAANDRGLDFWDQKYGTRMFTDGSPSAENDISSIKFEHIEGSDSHSYHVSQSTKPNYRLSGGVPTNNSHWAFNNKCLSLSHKGDREDRKVYVVISYVQDHGIHV
ncbi:hypothetical protein CHU98_g2655 [Xylaria longipes]|nr:hypothetical protein CHU98_g2655 [Xylaria longipes]